jgi:hypothetical protein
MMGMTWVEGFPWDAIRAMGKRCRVWNPDLGQKS